MRIASKLLLLFVFAFSKHADAKDSLYVYEQLHFKLTTWWPPTLQPSYPRTDEKGVTVYDYVEGKDSNEYYLAEIRVKDCREKMVGITTGVKQLFYDSVLNNVYMHHDPTPDSTKTFRGARCIIGDGDYVSGILHGDKKQRYIFIAFFHDDFFFEIIVSDTKKKVQASYEDFLNRFELI